MSAESEPQVAKALQDISTSVSALVSEEIALAKAEVGGKVRNLGVGAGVGAAAGVFLFFAFILFSHAIAWGFYELTNSAALAYLIAGLLYVILAALAGWFALRLLKKGSPPVPEMAIAEAKLTKEVVADARRNA